MCKKKFLDDIIMNLTKLISKKFTIKYSNFMFQNCALGTSMYRKLDCESVNGYDETMRRGFEDWEFFIHLLKSGGNTFVIHAVFRFFIRSLEVRKFTFVFSQALPYGENSCI